MKNNLSGFAILFIVTLIGLLAFIGLFFINVSNQNRNLAQNYILKIRADNLAHSGFDYIFLRYLEDFTEFDMEWSEKTVGSGTYFSGGDLFKVKAKDFNGRININDGVKAGQLHFRTDPNPPFFTIALSYSANAIDPYPNDAIDDPVHDDLGISGYLNLRLRRMLNAYGDVHRFVDKVYRDHYENVGDSNYYDNPAHNLPNPVLTTISEESSADGPRGLKMAYYLPDGEYDEKKNCGLGDRVIMGRPDGGYKKLTDVKDIVNQWAEDSYGESTRMISSQYTKTKRFYDLIEDDLTVISFEDTNFFQLNDETVFGTKLYDEDNPGDFEPKDMQFGIPGLKNIWLNHSVPLINLNQASFFVRACVFYAPTHVTYSTQGATTIPPYILNSGPSESFPSDASVESMIASPSIGIKGAVFDWKNDKQAKENGRIGQGRQYHLMSLTDAMRLSYHYEKYKETENKEILSFDEFREFLVWYETNGKMGNVPAYEKVSEKIMHEPTDENYDFNGGGLFGVCEYNDGCVFTQDYISKTLPHILSCIRRIPSWYGAPLALQSPYLLYKPDVSRASYWQSNQLVKQGFIKVEDFVSRIQHPKVSFLPLGAVNFQSIGVVNDQQGKSLVESMVSGSAQFFNTQFFRTQKDFFEISSHIKSSTHTNIRTGPNYYKEEKGEFPEEGSKNEHFGFIGLRDYDADAFMIEDGEISVETELDVLRDYVINGDDQFMSHKGGYRPQIVMNFSYNPFLELRNLAPALDSFTYRELQRAESSSDSWFDELTDILGPLGQLETIDSSNFFAAGNIDTQDISPFNGIFLNSISHGEFMTGFGRIKFGDPLCWRLDEWFKEFGGETFPVGQNASQGIMTFWFQLSSDYDYPTWVGMSGGVFRPESFSRTLVNLNLWEAYEYQQDDGFGPYIMKRPVSITVGTKKTIKHGLNVFARYDTGFEQHNGLVDLYDYDELGVHNFGYIKKEVDPDADSTLIPSRYDPLLSFQYNFIGFWCDNFEVDLVERASLNYVDYRTIAHRHYEVNVPFKNQTECAPGSWHRVTVYWDLAWRNNPNIMKSKKQLHVDLHESSNKKDQISDVVQDVTYYSLAANPADSVIHYDYPQTDVMRGVMLPYNSVRSLSLGESHARRLTPYTLKVDGEEHASEVGHYYPAWRLNSLIDNFRFYMGPSKANARDPVYQSYAPPISDDFFDPRFVSWDSQRNPYCALRYLVTREGNQGFQETNEPTYLANPISQGVLPNNIKVIQVGTRVYYPPDSNNNVPYVRLFAQNKDISTGIVTEYPIYKISQNEQNIFFNDVQADIGFEIGLQYMAFKPILDGDLNNMEAEPVIYYGEDNCTDIPWIKELNIRYATTQHPKIINLD